MRIYDRDPRVSDAQLRMMLDKAVLEEHGFKLEITSKLLIEPGSGSGIPVFQKTFFYFKTVDCSRVPEVNEEVDSLIPGITENNERTPGDLGTSFNFLSIVLALDVGRVKNGL